jgi:hypothetical protein
MIRAAAIPRPVALGLLCAAVLLTRLPFLGAGYGWHADNWRTALAARHIAETGAYEASRFPGYPVQEYACALFWKSGAWGFNFANALFCTGAAMFFALICIEYEVEDWWVAGFALAFVPVLYVNSVSAKDFPWALAFLLGSWWCALRKRPVWTGVLLGLAMGVRITSGAAALPIALILSDGEENWMALRRVGVTALTGGGIVAVAFAPVYARYGTDFFNFYSDHALAGPVEILKRVSVEVWGVLGTAGICVAVAAGLVKRAPRVVTQRRLLTWWSVVVIYVVAFLCLPDEAAYLIPAAPFVLLLVWWGAPRWAFVGCCGVMVLSPFVTLGRNGVEEGLVLTDHRDRVRTDESIGNFLQFTTLVSGSNAYIVGSWKPPIDVMTADMPRGDVKFEYLVTAGELDQLVKEGWRVWYLGEAMLVFEERVYGFDVRAHGARDVRELRPAQIERH